jgi:hypothetical protein
VKRGRCQARSTTTCTVRSTTSVEDGEHAVVAAYQMLVRSDSSESARRKARAVIEAYLETIER